MIRISTIRGSLENEVCTKEWRICTEVSINDKTIFSEGKRFIKDARIEIVINR